MTTTRPTHEVYAAAFTGTYKGACRICRYATAPVPYPKAVARIERHVAKVHGLAPEAVR